LPNLTGFYIRTDVQRTQYNQQFLDLVCDVCHLPFKSGSFEQVYASHILEHVDNPVQALKEMLRVSRKAVTVKVPHMLSAVAKQDTPYPFDKHKNVFRRKWFAEVLKNYGFTCKTNQQPWLLFFARPYEIEVTIFRAQLPSSSFSAFATDVSKKFDLNGV